MKLLLDTHVFLWCMTAPEKNSREVRRLLGEATNERLVGIVSLWELAIKVSLKKLSIRSGRFDQVIDQGIQDIVGNVLPITLTHIAVVESLPHHHRDPFDRLLVSQALVEGAVLLSADEALDAYSVPRIW